MAKSKLITLLELVEAGELMLAQDFVDDARNEIYDLLEGDSGKCETYEAAVDKMIAGMHDMAYLSDDPATVRGSIHIMEMDSTNGSGYRMGYRVTGSMMRPHSLVGAMQYMTSSIMDEVLGDR